MSVTFTATHAGAPALNLAGGNAARVLRLLGLPADEPWGECDAADFHGRVLLAQALLGTATTDEAGTPDLADGTWTWCGTAPGYLAGRLGELADLAGWARRHRAPVTWG